MNKTKNIGSNGSGLKRRVPNRPNGASVRKTVPARLRVSGSIRPAPLVAERSPRNRNGGVDSAAKLFETAALEIVSSHAPVLDPYAALVQRVRELILAVVPSNKTVIVVSKGDSNLAALRERRGWHFPQDPTGTYAGYRPADSGAAIAHLEALRARGGDFLVFPETAFWWLDHYAHFRRHLEQRYRLVTRRIDTAAIYSLREKPDSEGRLWAEFGQAVARCEGLCGRAPAILDWRTGLDLERRFPELSVFSPPGKDQLLPYVDSSVELVALCSRTPAAVAEARRVASLAVVTFIQNGARGPSASVEWQPHHGEIENPPSVSIVVPRAPSGYMDIVRGSLPDDFPGELLIGSAGLPQLPPAVGRGRTAPDLGPAPPSPLFLANEWASGASNEILVFLAEGAIPLPGWLPPLLRVFRDFPDAGVVGPKLLDSQGRLREAGCQTFADGSTTGFGQGEHAIDAALFSYVRKTDFCSEALLATRRSLFTELCGFDARYTDARLAAEHYCLAASERGFATYCQPETRVIQDAPHTATGESLGEWVVFESAWRHRLKHAPARPAAFDRATWYALADVDPREVER